MTATILSPTPENIALAAQAIQRGEILGMPTETVYGLAGNCRSLVALARIFEAKERPTFDPLIVHVGFMAKGIASLARLNLIDSSQLSVTQKTKIDQLISVFWPGPLTLVLPKHPDIPDLVTSGLPNVAIRMPRHPVAQALLAASECSLAAPSANRFGRISPTCALDVSEELGDKIDWVLDGGPCEIGLESTVLAVNGAGDFFILRPGGISKKKIEEVLGTSMELKSTGKAFPLAGPGMLESHYAPKKPFWLLNKKVSLLQTADRPGILEAIQNTPPESKLGLLLLAGDSNELGLNFSRLVNRPVLAKSLSPSGDFEETAHRLFAEMRLLDSSGVSAIFSEPCLSENGLGYAIADRLRRAAFNRIL